MENCNYILMNNLIIFVLCIILYTFKIGGLITYRENALYYNKASDTIAVKKRITTYVSHEISHQWFGNLVTMAWWNDLW